MVSQQTPIGKAASIGSGSDRIELVIQKLMRVFWSYIFPDRVFLRATAGACPAYPGVRALPPETVNLASRCKI